MLVFGFTLPELMPAIAAAALLPFTFSFDDYVLTAFSSGTTNTWPIVLFSAVRFGLAVSALATIMLGVTMLAVAITAFVLRRSRVRIEPGQERTGGFGAALGALTSSR